MIEQRGWSSPDELTVVQFDEHHAMGVWGEFLLIIWRSKTEHLAVTKARYVLSDLAKRHPGGVATLSVVEETALPPDADARRELSTLLSSGVGYLKSSSIVHEGTGFKAATVRGVVTAITMLAKKPVPHVIHSQVSESADWHMRQLGKPMAAARVRALCLAVEELRRTFARLPR